VNKTILGFSKQISNLWLAEKEASAESIIVAKEEALTYLAAERERIAKMTRDEAIQELIREQNIDNKISKINSVIDNGIMTFI